MAGFLPFATPEENAMINENLAYLWDNGGMPFLNIIFSQILTFLNMYHVQF